MLPSLAPPPPPPRSTCCYRALLTGAPLYVCRYHPAMISSGGTGGWCRFDLELARSEKGDGAAAVLRQGEREEGAVDAGGGCQAAGIHLQPWHRQLDLGSAEGRSSSGLVLHWHSDFVIEMLLSLHVFWLMLHGCRVEAVREELQAEVHELPEAQSEARELRAGGGGPHHHPPRHARKQVPLQFAPTITVHLAILS